MKVCRNPKPQKKIYNPSGDSLGRGDWHPQEYAIATGMVGHLSLTFGIVEDYDYILLNND